LQPRVADIVAVALRKKRRKGLEVGVARRDSEITDVPSGHGRVPGFGAGHAVNS
jgi:hypothetical protein